MNTERILAYAQVMMHDYYMANRPIPPRLERMETYLIKRINRN